LICVDFILEFKGEQQAPRGETENLGIFKALKRNYCALVTTKSSSVAFELGSILL